ncbi:MAG: hypothetical protein K5770_20160 [Lachnospiraceae bacterium]|nr:hypothetical protein [Lachnospiraceae bacterium]
MKTIEKMMDLPNRDFIEMTFVKETATGRGLNTQFVMENLGNGTFQITDGRVGIQVGRYKPKRYVRPMEDWDNVFISHLRRGYLVTKTKKMDVIKTTKGYRPIEDHSVREIFERLSDLANAVMEEAFSVKVENISDEMLDYGRDILKTLSTGYETMSLAEISNKLKVLWAAIPRRIDNLSKALPHTKAQVKDILEAEQELFEFMEQMVMQHKVGADIESFSGTILDKYGLIWTSVTDGQKDWILKKLQGQADHFVNAWRITNKFTEKRFDDFCKKEGLTEKKRDIASVPRVKDRKLV